MFSSFVVGYLFLGGTGAGACVLLALFGLLAPRNRVSTMGMSSRARKPVRLMRAPHAYVQLMAPAFTAACAALVVGALFLMLDLGSVEKALLLFAFPTPTYLTFGAYALALLMAVSLLLSHAWWSGGSRWRYGAVQALHACALVVGIVVMVYTGLLLADMPAVPFWHTAWGASEPRHPHTIVIDMATNYKVTAITYLSRQDGNQNGMVKSYEVYLSTDGETWGTAAVSGTFQNTTALQTAKLKTATTARYLKFVAKSEVNGNAWTSAAEIGIEAEDEATAVSALQIQPEGTKYVYDLRGHRHDTTLGSLPHGIYIAGGRKVVK